MGQQNPLLEVCVYICMCMSMFMCVCVCEYILYVPCITNSNNFYLRLLEVGHEYTNYVKVNNQYMHGLYL